MLAGLRRIAPVDDRVEEDPVLFGIGDGCGLFGAGPDRPDRVHVERDPDPCTGQRASETRECEPVAEQQVVCRRGGKPLVAVAGRVHPDSVALVRDDLRLVDRDPHPADVADRLGDDLGVLGEVLAPYHGWPSRPHPRGSAADPSDRA